jgi:predicted  nucleic acid-binding Zn-ribbon protein
LLQQATHLAGGNSRYAVEIAQKLSDQLWPAQKRVAELEARVAELEAEVQLYRDKSERAELWLGKISSEIQQRVLGGDD